MWYLGRICEARDELDGRCARQMYRVHYDDGTKSWTGDGRKSGDLLMLFEWQEPQMAQLATQPVQLAQDVRRDESSDALPIRRALPHLDAVVFHGQRLIEVGFVSGEVGCGE